MDQLPERSLMRNFQKEQERERRRIRDRQRRQSMTVEEREKHLARRRRNYQLRRQRAEIAQLDPQLQVGLASRSEMLMLPSNENQEMVFVSDFSVQCNGIAHDSSDQMKESLNAGHSNSVGLEVPAHQLSKLPRRSRLNHIKHLARSIDEPADIVDNHKIAAYLILKGSKDPSFVPQKGLRLNRIKRLARALCSDLTQTASQSLQTETDVEQSLPSGESQLMITNLPKEA